MAQGQAFKKEADPASSDLCKYLPKLKFEVYRVFKA